MRGRRISWKLSILLPFFPENIGPFFPLDGRLLSFPDRPSNSVRPARRSKPDYHQYRSTHSCRNCCDVFIIPAIRRKWKFFPKIRGNPGRMLSTHKQMLYKLEKKGWIVMESKTRKGSVGPLKRKFVRVKGGADMESIYT